MRSFVTAIGVFGFIGLAAAQDRPGPPPDAPRIERIFNVLDANGDGAVDREELRDKLPQIVERVREGLGRAEAMGRRERARGMPPVIERPDGPPRELLEQIKHMIDRRVDEVLRERLAKPGPPPGAGPQARRGERGPMNGSPGWGPPDGARAFVPPGRGLDADWPDRPRRLGPSGGPGWFGLGRGDGSRGKRPCMDAPRPERERPQTKRPPIDERGPVARDDRPRPGMGPHGLWGVLDANHDGALDAKEIERAGKTLRELKGDRDALTLKELEHALKPPAKEKDRDRDEPKERERPPRPGRERDDD